MHYNLLTKLLYLNVKYLVPIRNIHYVNAMHVLKKKDLTFISKSFVFFYLVESKKLLPLKENVGSSIRTNILNIFILAVIAGLIQLENG